MGPLPLPSSSILPPPSQVASRRHQSHSNSRSLSHLSHSHSHSTCHSTESSRDNSARHSDGSFTQDPNTQHPNATSGPKSTQEEGPPPEFGFEVSSIVPLSKLERILNNNHNQQGRPTVSILAALVVKDQLRQTKTNKTVGTWTLEDPTGRVVELCLWEKLAEEWDEVTRSGDIIYLQDVGLSRHGANMQLTPSNQRSKIQICYRTRVFEPEDEVYRFGLNHVELCAKTRAVWTVVEWYLERLISSHLSRYIHLAKMTSPSASSFSSTSSSSSPKLETSSLDDLNSLSTSLPSLNEYEDENAPLVRYKESLRRYTERQLGAFKKEVEARNRPNL